MTLSAEAEVAPRAGRREWLGLAVLALPTLVVSVDISVLFLALPHVVADLHASTVEQLWITDIYPFMVAGFLITMGSIGDRIGRRKLLIIGAAVFALASLLAAYAGSPAILIAARAGMGIAGATLAPSSLALISMMFRDQRQQGTAIAIWMTAFMAGVAFGPAVGGALLSAFWWGSVFLVSAVFMAVLFIAGPFVLPEMKNPQPGPLDAPSVVLSLLAILPVIYGLKELARHGWETVPILAVVAGLAFAFLFVYRQRRLPVPMLDIGLFANKAFTTIMVTGMLVGALQSGTGLFVSLYMQMVKGLSPLAAGLWGIPPAIALVVGINLAPQLARKIKPGVVLAVGLLVAAVGQLVLSQVGPGTALAVVLIALAIVFLGMGPAGALVNQIMLSIVPPEKVGTAASTSGTGGELGVAFGIAALGSIGSAVYRVQIDDTLPAGLPAPAADAARESVAGAVAVSGSLPSDLANAVLTAARDAFTTGLNVVAGINTAGFVLLAAVVFFGLRAVGTLGAQPGPPVESVTEKVDQ
ncbi:MFS transporter [Dactylosporangium sp. CS-033363]|uniref:MFS transporter n=1 Tax=Dactylosporangium sp. CS-033363 TaxID=3239935 RepID=UPI003D8BE520